MKYACTVFTLLLITTLSCKKKDPHYNTGGVLYDKVVAGEEGDMFVIVYDTSISYSQIRPSQINLDVNDDGTDDIRIEIAYVGSPGTGYRSRSKIKCLHSQIRLAGSLFSDTVYSRHQIVVSEPEAGITMARHYSINDCRRESSSDESAIINPQMFYPFYFRSGEEVSNGMVLKNDTAGIPLVERQHEILNSAFQSGDTLYYKITRNLMDCRSFPLAENRFIGFSLRSAGVDRLGWFQLWVDENNTTFTVERSAIQR